MTTTTPPPNGLKHMLPKDYSPSDYDFVIGRGKQVKQHTGNQRLYHQIRSIADDYTSGDKARKSFLLSHLVRQVYQESPDAGFVKRDPTTGRWYAVEDSLARTSAAQAVRDCLHNHYKSSKQFKQQRRRKARQQQEVTSGFAADFTVVPPPAMARTITPDDSFYGAKPAAVPSFVPQEPSNDLFSILASAFATSKPAAAVTPEDPFEPVPILEDNRPRRMMTPSARMRSILESIDVALDMPLPGMMEPTPIVEQLPIEDDDLGLDTIFSL